MTIRTCLRGFLIPAVLAGAVFAFPQDAQTAPKKKVAKPAWTNAADFDAAGAVKRCGKFAFVKRNHFAKQSD